MLHPRSWVDDESVAECCRCATPFTFLRRRHHCRHCGGVFCGPCTQQQLWLRPWPMQSLQERLPSQAQSLADNNSNNDDDDDGHRINRVVSRAADVVREHASGSPSHNRNASSLSTNSDRNVANAEAEPPLFECVPRATAAPATATAAVGGGSCAGVPDTGAADQRTRSAGAAGAPHFRTISSSSRGGGAMSRQVSDAFFSSSVYTISPMTVGGDGSQQTWATPTPLPGLERTTSQQHAPSASISSAEALNESRPPRVPATAALEERSVAPRSHHHSSKSDHAGYLRASYQVEVDARKTLWLLCRVCQACYDSLLDTILDAHEQSSPLAPPTHPPTESPATSRSQLGPYPLWQYVRLSRSSTHSSSHTGVQPSSPDAPPSLTLTNSGSTPGAGAATPPRPGGTWARLRNSLSFPSSPLSSFVSTASVALQSEGSDPSAMPPPALRPHDLRRTREAAASPTAAPSPSRTQQSTKGPARGTLAATAGVPGLPARLYEPAVAAAGSRGGPVPSDGSRHSSPASLGHVTDASMLSVSSVSLQPGSRQATDVVSPKLKYAQQQQSQQRSVRFLVTPPRRRLISIGSTTGHIRQACAIARRRRRVAVILIDEREPAELDESTVRVRLTEARGDWAQLATAAFLSRQQQQQLPLQQSQLTSRAAQPTMVASTVLSLSPCASPTSPNACSARYDGVAAEGRRDGATSVGPPIATPVPAPLTAEESTSTEEATTAPATATAATPTTFENASLAQDPQLSSLSLESPTVRVHGAVAQPSGSRPALSIVVDVENEDGSSEAGGQSRDHAALCGLSPHDWLQPTLPAEAIALPASGTNSNTNINNSANFPLTSIGSSSSSSNNTHHSKKHTIACDSDSLATHALEYRSETPSPHWMGRDGHARTAGATPPDAALATTSRPISCAGVQGPSPSTPRHTAAAALAPAHQQQQQQHRLPALALAADCGSCVLSALFHDLGATRATAFATPLLAALTPAAAAAGGARLLRGGGAAGVTSAAAAAAAYMDPVVMAGGLPPTDWGTGPDSYAAQRQALVRELVLRQHRHAVGAAGGGDGSVSPVTPPAGSSGSGNTQRSPPTLEAAFGSGAGVFSAAAATPRSTALSPLSLHERVTAPMSVFFQLRAQSDEPAAPSPSHSAGAGANAALPLSPLSILPVVAQVEMVGIPVDVSASPAQALPKPTQTPTRAFTVSPRTLAISGSSTHAASAAAAAAGTQRPFTLAEFLPQLSRLSTNLDGYLVVVLRCGSRHRHHPCESASPNLRPTDCSPTAAPPGHGVRSRGGSEYVNAPAAAGGKARQHTVSTTAATAYRSSRVTDPFGGPQLRLLHQQLQSCGVAQPALSIVEVCEDSPSSIASSPSGWRTGGHGSTEAEASPASVASASSPFSDRGGRSSVFTAAASTAAVASPMCTRQSTSANTTINIATATAAATAAQMWSHSSSSPNTLAVSPVMAAAASPLMPASSSTRLLVPAAAPPEDAYGRMSNEHQQPVRRSLDRPEVLDKLTLPSSLQSTREPLSMPEASAAQQLPAGAEMRRNEQMRLAAQERAMATLRATSKQLGLPIATVAYPSAAGGALESSAMISGAELSAESPLRSGGAAVGGDAGRTPKGKNGGGGVTASNALLARGLESLMATMVYRDLTAQQ